MKVCVREIEVGKIVENKNNANSMEGWVFEELKKQIEKFGFLGSIVVRSKNGKYEILDGEKRYRALVELGYKKIPCYVVDIKDEVEFLIECIKKDNIRGEIDKEKLREKIEELEYFVENVRFNNLKGRTDRYKMALNLIKLQEKFDKENLKNLLVLEKTRYKRFLDTLEVVERIEESRKEEKRKQNEVENVILVFYLSKKDADEVKRVLRSIDEDENRALVRLCEMYKEKKIRDA